MANENQGGNNPQNTNQEPPEDTSAGNPGLKNEMADTPDDSLPMSYEEMSLKQLQAELERLNFVGADTITSKSACIAVINNLLARQAQIDVALQQAASVPTAAPTRDNPVQEKRSYDQKAKATAAWYKDSPTVKFTIPREPGEGKFAFLPVCINGWRVNILKGRPVSMPERLQDYIVQIMDDAENAGEEFNIDRMSQSDIQEHAGLTVGEILT